MQRPNAPAHTLVAPLRLPRIALALGALALCALAPAPISAASGTSLDEAQEMAAAGDWEGAARAFSILTGERPEGMEAWQGLGISLLELHRDEEALAALERALELGAPPAPIAVRGAQAAWRLERRQASLDWLDKAVEAGLPARVLLSAPRLQELQAGLGDDPDFKKLIEKARRGSEPCRYDPNYRQLDFWVGEWEVYAGDRLAGANRIEKTVDGCLLVENWESATSTGKSFNFYDPGLGKWRQEWVGGSGGVIRFEAQLSDGAMHFEGRSISRDGSIKPMRMELRPGAEGTVRQLIEVSNDDGATWTTWFDGLYRKRDEAASGAPAQGLSP